MTKRLIRHLTVGDMVKLEPNGTGMITRARPAPERFALPHRRSVPRSLVPAWSVCWRVMRGERAGQIAQAHLDPDDSVELTA